MAVTMNSIQQSNICLIIEQFVVPPLGGLTNIMLKSL